MVEIVDARGLSCPEPVIISRKALQETEKKEAVVLVSSSVARDNVSRAVKTLGWSVTVEDDAEGFKLNLAR